MLAVVPADRRRASAIRRFPPGCGRHHNAAAQPPQRPLPSTTSDPSARAPTKTACPPPRRTLPASASSRTVGPDCGVGNGRKAAATVNAPCVSAVRRYPPGCGRSVAVSKPPALVGEGVGEAGAGKPPAVVCNGEAKASSCHLEAVLLGCALDHGKSDSDGWMKNGGGGDAGAQEEGGGKPWILTGLMAVPLLPWAQHGRRSQRLKVL